MSPIFIHCGCYILFQRKTTHFLNMVCHLSQLDALLTCFMNDFYFCIATFASLIARILLCLHMQTHSVLEIDLYADQINILHLRNQSILSWIPRNRNKPITMVLRGYSIMCSTPFQCPFIGEKLNLASKFTAKQISGQILLVRCTSALIAPRYRVSSPRLSSSFF